MAKQPDGYIVYSQGQNPHGFIPLDRMFSDTRYRVVAKKAVLLIAMIGGPQVFERGRIHLAEIQFDSLPDIYRSSKCEAVYVTQALCFYSQPVTEMAERLKFLYFNAVVRRDFYRCCSLRLRRAPQRARYMLLPQP